MKFLVIIAPTIFVLATLVRSDDAAEGSQHIVAIAPAGEGFTTLNEKRQDKRGIGYTTGLGGYSSGFGVDTGLGLLGGGVQNGYYSPYNTRVAGLGVAGLGGYTNSGYNNAGYTGYNGYNGYSGLGYPGYTGGGGGGGGFVGVGYNNPAFYSRFGYPYTRPGYTNSYPSSYYSSNYANSIVGGGLGGLGDGLAAPVPIVRPAGVGGYHYGPGVSGTIY